MPEDHLPSPSLGADLRALRRSRGETLDGMATALGKSVGWLSQVERDISDPSFSDLEAIAAHLNVPISLFFGQTAAQPLEQGRIVRAAARRMIGDTAGGLTEALLSPDLTDDFEVIHSTFAPHSRLKAPKARGTTELGYIISGKLTLTLGDDSFTVGPGDSFRIKDEPYHWANPHNTPVTAIWVIAPPVY